MAGTRSLGRRLLREGGKGVLGLAMMAALVWLAFSLGAWMAENNTPLAYRAGLSAQTVTGAVLDLAGSADERPVESERLTLKVSGSPPRGPILAVPGGTQALLLNRKGRIVHRWDVDHAEAFPGSDLPDTAVRWREPVLMPDGDLVAVPTRRRPLSPFNLAAGRYGLGVVRVAPDGTVRWTNPLRAHHVPVRAPNGDILVLWRRPRTRPDPRYPDLHTPFFAEGIARLDAATGKVLRRAAFRDLLAGSGAANLLHRPAMLRDGTHLKGEVFHANTIRPVTPAAARNAAFADAGDLVVSFRNLSTAAVLDADTWRVKTLLRGPWTAQHDVAVLASGRVTAYDNTAPDGGSRVVVWDPGSGRITATYGGRDLNARILGMRQRLAGGGVLAVDPRGHAIAYGPDGGERWRLVLDPPDARLCSVRRVPRGPVAALMGAGEPPSPDGDGR